MIVIINVVSIAGHYDGIIGENDRANHIKLAKNGKPNVMRPEYRELLGLRKKFPKQTRVLNNRSTHFRAIRFMHNLV